ncbi:MAG: serine hydrolase [Bryobacterales bacterium]|nr:serine hydrolase [Bryobacterales bacterium]
MLWRVVAALCMAAGVLGAQPAGDLRARLREYLEAQEDVNGFSGAVLVLKNGQMLLRTGVGACDREARTPCKPQTRFRIGSITKTFTATAVLMLAERKKLGLQDAVSKHLPYAPESWKDVTIHHLLSHTSGIPSYTEPKPAEACARRTAEELVALFRDKPLDFAPGSQWAYSNSGYVLLGEIVSQVAGMSYEAFLRQAIFEPLGMSDSGYEGEQPLANGRAVGYSRAGGRWAKAECPDVSLLRAAGGLYTTVDDLQRFDEGLRKQRLLTLASLQRMYTPVASKSYGYGWALTTFGRHKVVAHGGSIEGFAAFLARIPEEQTLVVVLSNVEQTRVHRMAQELADLAYGQTVELPRRRVPVSLRNEVFDKYVGTYELAPNLLLTVSREGGRYLLQATGQAQVEMYPEAETKFFLRVADAQVTFITDPSGVTHSLLLHQNGRDMKGKKVD